MESKEEPYKVLILGKDYHNYRRCTSNVATSIKWKTALIVWETKIVDILNVNNYKKQKTHHKSIISF
jgi:hypothetical protein